MKKICLIASLAVILLLTQSCASIFSRSEYPVTFASKPTEANVKITNRYGMTIFSGSTPSTVVLSASEGFFTRASYMVEYSKPGYETVRFPLVAQIDGWYFGNILVFPGFGVLGMLIIDPATGAMWKLDEYVFVEMASSRKADNAIEIMDINDVPEDMKASLVQIR